MQNRRMERSLTGRWSVVSGLLCKENELLLVANRRRRGTLEWSPPGGVCDPGEDEIQALNREVFEETGVTVESWSEPVYEVTVDFVDRKMVLNVRVFQAGSWYGDLIFEDPDEIVEMGKFVKYFEAIELLGTAPLWVSEPVRFWISGGCSKYQHFHYVVQGSYPNEWNVERI